MYVFAVHISIQNTYVQSPLRVLVVGRDSNHKQVCQVPRPKKKATRAKPLFNPICFLCVHHFSSNLPHCPLPKSNKLSSSDEESSFRVFNRSMRRPTSSYFGSLPARMSVVFEESGAGTQVATLIHIYQMYVHVGRRIYMDDILTYYFNFHFYYYLLLRLVVTTCYYYCCSITAATTSLVCTGPSLT